MKKGPSRIRVNKRELEMFPLNEMKIDPFWDSILFNKN